MLRYLEMKQHSNTVLFTVGKILMHHLAEYYPVLQTIPLDFNEALKSAPPVLTLTCADNDSLQDISYILTTKAPVHRASVNSSCQRNSFSFTQLHLVVGMWPFRHWNTPSHIILNCDYLSIPRLYVPFHPAVYHISEEEAAGEKQSHLVDCLLYCK